MSPEEHGKMNEGLGEDAGHISMYPNSVKENDQQPRRKMNDRNRRGNPCGFMQSYS